MLLWERWTEEEVRTMVIPGRDYIPQVLGTWVGLDFANQEIVVRDLRKPLDRGD
jgi:hypothetical protein